jgi:DNA-binding NarL/FixJ family response regulator
LEFYRLSYQLSLDTKDEHSQNIALNNIGEVLALQKNPETIAILQSPEKYFGNIKDYVSLQQTYTYYTTYYRNIKDAENTIKFLDKLRNVDSKLNDSLQRKSIVFYQTKYETQQKENKIQLLSKSDSIKNLKIFSQELAINKNILQHVRQKLALSGAQLQMVEDSLQISTQSKTILKNQLETVLISKEIYPDIQFLMLTAFSEDEKIFDAVKAGASGYLLKDEKISKIVSSITELLDNGSVPMSPIVAQKTLEMIKNADKSLANNYTNKDKSDEIFDFLSNREIEILHGIVDGLNYKEIAEKLFISPHTVRKHISNIYDKLHVTNKTAAIKIALKKKWFN